MAELLDIVFLTAGSKPGKDGVGDYVRRVGGELASRGYSVGWLAWRDPHVLEVKRRVDHGIMLMRLPAAMTELARRERAIEWWQSHHTRLVSWQLTPYGFHRRGWVGALGVWLRQQMGDAQVQLMVHEIWVGAKRESSPRERVAGHSQVVSWRRMLRGLHPNWVHTQSLPYQHMLRRLGQDAGIIPLCGNIPVVEATPPPDDHFRAGFFGTLYEPLDEAALFDELQRLGQHLRRPVKVLAAGHLGRHGEARWERWQAEPPHGFAFERVKGKAPDTISGYLQSLDLGMTTTPVALLEKSGTVASMQEHGLRVRVLRDDVSFPGMRNPKPAANLCPPREDLVAWWQQSEDPPKHSRLPEVADAYERLIQEARG
ncbi:MAG: hypothetical protein E1N59_1799 [Puniceicoccaceae bacterium 5H]|nr:MAG: hypothetical protein E1N59_1799 [Puniceicoccaceae bacterium 5H]